MKNRTRSGLVLQGRRSMTDRTYAIVATDMLETCRGCKRRIPKGEIVLAEIYADLDCGGAFARCEPELEIYGAYCLFHGGLHQELRMEFEGITEQPPERPIER